MNGERSIEAEWRRFWDAAKCEHTPEGGAVYTAMRLAFYSGVSITFTFHRDIIGEVIEKGSGKAERDAATASLRRLEDESTAFFVDSLAEMKAIKAMRDLAYSKPS